MPRKTLAGSIVVVAKCPIPGQSKTRLIPLTGREGSSQLAEAMLADVLTSATLLDIGNRYVDRILLYAPDTDEGRRRMEELMDLHSIPRQQILQQGDAASECSGSTKSSRSSKKSSSSRKSSRSSRKSKMEPNLDAWTLLPMSNERLDKCRTSSSSNNGSKNKTAHSPLNLKSSFLSSILANALHRARQRQKLHFQAHGPVVFVGMDSPELPLDQVEHALLLQPQQARLCPAADGGYGLLSVPPKAPAQAIFHGVRWSDPLTAVSQIKALTDQNIVVTLGRLMHDIDEPDDVQDLVQRLKMKSSSAASDNDQDGTTTATEVLLRGSQKTARTGSCLFTRQALHNLGLWSDKSKKKKGSSLTVQTDLSGSTECSTGEPGELREKLTEDEEEDFALEHQLTPSSTYTL